MKNYILYARKSTDTEDKQVYSLEAQKRELKELAQKIGINIVATYEESMSAKKPGRPIFSTMMDHVKQKDVQGILCWKIDRLSRNLVDTGTIMHMLQQGEIEAIKTHSGEYKTADSVYPALMEFAVANQYIRDLSENVKRGNRQKLSEGGYPNKAPLGYQNNIATKEIEPDAFAPYITEIFGLYATGLYSLKSLSEKMYEQGMRTNTGRKVYPKTIHEILNRTLYYGEYIHEDVLYKLNHETLTTKDVFKQCQHVMFGNRQPRKKSHTFTYSGFASCEDCGCAITAEIKKGKYIYYHCTNGRGACNQRSQNVREESIESIFMQELSDITFDPELVELAYQAKLEELNSNATLNDTKILEQLETQITAIDQKQSKLLDLHLADGITDTAFKEKNAELDVRRHELNDQLDTIRSQAHDPYATIELIKNVFMRGYTLTNEYSSHDVDGKRQMLSEVLSNFTLKDKEVASFQYKSQYEVIRKNAHMDEISFMLTSLREVRTSILSLNQQYSCSI